MGIYLVSRTDRVGWDEYDSVVIRARNEAAAMKIATEPSEWRGDGAEFSGFSLDGSNLKIEAIPAKGKAEVILSSFNAG